MKIEAVNIRLVNTREGGLRALADVHFDVILIRDFRIFKQHGKHYVHPPYTTFKKDGRTQFNQIIELPEELRVQVDAAILSAFFREQEKAHGQDTR